MVSESTWVVAPAFNEGKVLASTISDILQGFSNVVVIDDCSTDDTYQVALQAGAHICRHPVNLGQGAALQTGMVYALQQGAQIIVTFDADGQHLPRDAESMVAKLRESDADVVLASRFLGASAQGMSASKKALLKAATLYTRVTTGLALTDTHNGLRVLSRKAAASIKLRQNRMAHASEILKEIVANELRVVEHPATIVYTDYSRAKGQRMSGALTILADIFLRRLYR